MLKKRIIPIQLLSSGRLVKTTHFDQWRDVGDPVKSSAVYSAQLADELVFLNIDRDHRNLRFLVELIERVSQVCFMPITMGGGITSFSDASFLILNGADKVLVNSAAYVDTAIITRTAEEFGTQAVVVGVDVLWDHEAEAYRLYSDCGRRCQHVDLETHIARVVAAGAGEIFIQSINRDGMMGGFDLTLIRRVMAVSTVPVIAAGGSGNYGHLRDAFVETDVAAVACGSLFNFSDSNPLRAKAYLGNYGIPFKVV